MNTVSLNTTAQNISVSRRASQPYNSADFGIALQSMYAPKGIEKTVGTPGDTDLKSMYVHVTAHQYHLPRSTRQAMSVDAYWEAEEKLDLSGDKREFYTDDKYVNVPVGLNELPELLDRLSEARRNGVSLRDALLEQSRKYTSQHIGKFVDINTCDSMWVNTETGDIEHVTTRQRRGQVYCGTTPAEHDLDITATLAIADDFATFMRYTYFRQDSDDPAAVNAILGEIKQMRYNTDRYVPLNDAEIAAHEGEVWKRYFEMLERKAEDALDTLLDMIDRHCGLVNDGLDMREDEDPEGIEESPLTADGIAARLSVNMADGISGIAV